ncbi:hypothetical protein MCEMIEM28_01335 [Burkholderiaceae bacterium]
MRTIVSPTFAIEWRDVDDFLGEFGPYNGRYVPRFPKDWLEQLRHHLDELDVNHLPPKERAALFERLRRELLHCTSPANWAWDPDKSWSENLLSASGLAADDLIAGDALDPTPFSTWSQIASDVKRTRNRTLNFNGLVSSYVDLCKPLLLNAPSAFLIDPYLDPFSGAHRELLLSFLANLSGSKCYSIELITYQSACGNGNRPREEPPVWMTEDEIQLELKETYRSYLPKDRQLRVHLVQTGRKHEGGLALHDRFFLTNHGAINFGHGFKISNQTKTMQNAFIVDKQHHETLKEVYINGVARFLERLPKRASITYPKSVSTISLMG